MSKEDLKTSHEVILEKLIENINKYCLNNNTEIRTTSLSIKDFEAKIEIKFKGYTNE